MKEHTKGPWEIREIAHEATPFNERRVYRVEIGSPIIGNGHRYGTRPVCQITDFGRIGDPANARLIAAAPDLLAVCERILNHPLIRLTGDVEPRLVAALHLAKHGAAPATTNEEAV